MKLYFFFILKIFHITSFKIDTKEFFEETILFVSWIQLNKLHMLKSIWFILCKDGIPTYSQLEDRVHLIHKLTLTKLNILSTWHFSNNSMLEKTMSIVNSIELLQSLVCGIKFSVLYAEPDKFFVQSQLKECIYHEKLYRIKSINHNF